MLRTMTPIAVAVFIIGLFVRHIDTTPALSPFSYRPRITRPDSSHDRIKIDGEAVEHWRHTEGDLAVMKCITDLNDYPIISWRKDGRPAPTGTRVYEFINKGNSFLEIPRVALKDEGNYTCSVSHELGYATKQYRICVIKRGVKEDCPRWWYNWNY
ncbi:Hemicentin-2 [Orchesella cincta]|uniref:Hemicentin-2 n=1 Tax=Orchesella cincta TaxID=48709 RepID=A0A1D2NA76_ORCCI|nr:Hemicentin-2 [Orchesella cincta]